jgi:hypothetical protein
VLGPYAPDVVVELNGVRHELSSIQVTDYAPNGDRWVEVTVRLSRESNDPYFALENPFVYSSAQYVVADGERRDPSHYATAPQSPDASATIEVASYEIPDAARSVILYLLKSSDDAEVVAFRLW